MNQGISFLPLYITTNSDYNISVINTKILQAPISFTYIYSKKESPEILVFIKSFKAVNLHQSIFENGKLVYHLPDEYEAQDYLKNNLSILWEENKRYLNPQDYPVDLSTKCWENKHKRIFEVAEHVKEMEDENE